MIGILLSVSMLAAAAVSQDDPTAVEADSASELEAKNRHPAGPLAVVYRGDAGCDGCSEAVADVLKASKFRFRITFVGPKEAQKTITASLLAKAALYAQPGGEGTVDAAFKNLAGATEVIRDFVKGGGRYLGFCMGGYFAGDEPGFGMIDADQWITTPGATVKTDADTLVDIVWRGQHRTMYFQDGPYFTASASTPGTTILATYQANDKVAAMVVPFGAGKVGVTGPHPEAPASWYQENHLQDPDGLDADLAQDLVETLMR